MIHVVEMGSMNCLFLKTDKLQELLYCWGQ